MRTDTEGSDLRELYNGCGDGTTSNAIVDADGNVFISDRSTPAVVTIGKDGNRPLKLTHTTDGKKLGCAVGQVLDRMGNILCADKNHNCVYIIGRNRNPKELVGYSLGTNEPRDLAVDNENNLWITQYDGKIRVVKYSVL